MSAKGSVGNGLLFEADPPVSSENKSAEQKQISKLYRLS